MTSISAVWPCLAFWFAPFYVLLASIDVINIFFSIHVFGLCACKLFPFFSCANISVSFKPGIIAVALNRSTVGLYYPHLMDKWFSRFFSGRQKNGSHHFCHFSILRKTTGTNAQYAGMEYKCQCVLAAP